MKKRFLLSFLAIPFAIAACSPSAPASPTDTGGGGGGGGGTDTIPDTVPIDSDKAEEYERWINTWSERGHIYFHYLRPGATESEYDDWGIWAWQNSPKDLEGSMWGAVSDAMLATVPHPMTRTRMTNIGGSGKSIDDFGVIYDIDTTRTDIVGGKTGKPVTLCDEKTKRMGFLVAQLSSMDGTKHWTSDGGSNLYIKDFQSHWRSNGSMHIFITRGNASNFTYNTGVEIQENPTVTDKTGQYRSAESRLTDKYAGRYPSTSTAFKAKNVGYQVFVASFRDSDGDGVGDIRGIIDSLDYLKNDLHVDTLWLTPVQTCESYHGYDAVDYYSIDARFGTDADYAELISKAHAKGMAVLMDLVLNHTSKNNTWYTKSQMAEVSADPASGQAVQWRNIYHWKFKGDTVKYYNGSQYVNVAVENHPDWYKDGESDYYYYGKFGSGMPELNYDNQETRNLVINLGKFWMAKGVDGFRLDAVKHIYMKDEVADSGNDIVVSDIGTKNYYDEQLKKRVSKAFDYSSDVTRNIEFWKEFSFGLKADYPNAFLVGENFDGYGARIAPYYQALDSQFDFSNFFHIDEWLYQNKDGKNAKNYTTSQKVDSYDFFTSNANNSTIYNNNGAITHTNYPTGHRSDFINGAFTSNHDTLRAINHVNPNSVVAVTAPTGERYAASKVTGTAAEIGKAKVAAAMTILNPGLSWIYYGDELGMSSNTNKHYEIYGNENNEDIWYRQPFKWNDSSLVPNLEFNGYKIEWDEYNTSLKSMETQKTTNGSMLKYYMGLTTIKAMFGSGARYNPQTYGDSNVLVYWTVTAGGTTYNVYVNSSGSNATCWTNGNTRYIVNASSGYSTQSASGQMTLAPYSVVVSK